MKTVVIYKSNYGSTEIYAKWIAEDLKADLLKSEKVNPSDFQKYDIIVYGGGLYAGSVNGISLLTKNLTKIQGKELFLFAVGSSDMTVLETTNAISNAVRQKLPEVLLKQLHIYHFRGGMQYSKMSFVHRTMMKMMIKMLRKKPENELRADAKDMIENFGRDVDFTDRTAIEPMISVIKSIKKM